MKRAIALFTNFYYIDLSFGGQTSPSSIFSASVILIQIALHSLLLLYILDESIDRLLSEFYF
jgi:hypothetical protein